MIGRYTVTVPGYCERTERRDGETRVIRPAIPARTVTVELQIDDEALARLLAERAVRARSGKATMAARLIRCTYVGDARKAAGQ